MPICDKCKKYFPNRIMIDGKFRIINKRRFCIECSPFGLNNRKDLSKYNNELGYRKCTKCNEYFPMNKFYANGKEHNPHSTCKKCFTKDIQIRQINKKKKAIEYLGGKCKHCGIDNPIVLEFHHLDKSKKEASWDIIKRWNWERMKIELNKCILLCANCHVIEHAIFYTEIGLNSNSCNK